MGDIGTECASLGVRIRVGFLALVNNERGGGQVGGLLSLRDLGATTGGAPRNGETLHGVRLCSW